MNFNPPTDPTISRALGTWFASVGRILNNISATGTTAQRPIKGLQIGQPYFDSTLGYAIWYNGSVWVDATGGTV
jgi:hypothetical protein